MKTTPLAPQHISLGAKMVPFAGWEMPIQYAGIVVEHNAVRNSLGVFDISHMGQFALTGHGAGAWLNGMLTNDLNHLEDGEGQYTLMLNEKGGVIDDMIVYRRKEDDFFLVVNASKEVEDWDWLNSKLPAELEMKNHSTEFGALAVQGPDAERVWKKVMASESRGGSPHPTSAPENQADKSSQTEMLQYGELPKRNGIAEFPGSVIVCRTGYTGEDGFELFAPTSDIGDWFTRFLEAGAEPCGLGARDTLRLEKCYPLNGNDLDPEHTPLEAGLGFFVKLDKAAGFVGSDVLSAQKTDGLSVKLAALKANGKGPPPRGGYELALPGDDGEVVSKLTSGGQSPTLKTGIALAYLPKELAKVGTALDVIVRDRRYPVEVVKKPFV